VTSSERSAPLSDLWLKAAVLGSLWASIEIIVGSFLHNLRIPLAGSLLAATGAGLLTGAHQIWPERGLFWRAGLICALMKSISPTAVVLGPMIGIFTESLLLEAATRLLGRTALGYAVGGALAVSSTLFQKIAGFIVTFGLNVVALYVRLCEFAARSLRLPFLGPLELLVALAVIDVLLGASVALAARRVGRKTRAVPLPPLPQEEGAWHGFKLDPQQKFSLVLLAGDLTGLAAGLLLLQAYPLWAALLWAAAFTVWVGHRYRGGLRRFRRPRLWIELAALMLLSGLLLGASQNGLGRWTWNGLREGLEMIVRAWLIIAGFAAVSVELRNPRIIEWFTRRRMRGFSDALGVAFQALPAFAAALAEQRQFVRRPLAALSHLLGQADAWLQAYQRKQPPAPRVIILAGDLHQGKTSVAAEVVRRLRERGLAVGGLLAPGLWRDGERWGFDIEDLLDGRRPLCRRDAAPQEVAAGPFKFLPEGLEFGRQALSLTRLKAAGAAVVVVDEVGPLELSEAGWAQALDALVAEWPGPMLWVVRRGLVNQVAARWLDVPPLVLDITEADPSGIARWLAGGPD